MPRDFYDVLSITRKATQDEIKAAYRKLVRKYHPDASKNDPAAATKFKEVQEAHEILTDAKKREAYDRFGHAGVQEGAPEPQGRRGGRSRNSKGWGASAPNDFADVDLNDIFQKFAGFSRRQRGPARPETTAVSPPPNYDITHDVTLSFEQAARGTKLSVQLIGANGQRPETLEVTIPPGVHEGSRVRVRGRGQGSPYGGRGDLNIVTHIERHPYFTRDGDDVLLDLPISIDESLRGATVNVPTLDGPIAVKVPAGINTNKKLRIKGRGIGFPNRPSGDQLCRILLMLPAQLSDAAKKDLQKWCESNSYNAREAVPWVL